MVPEKYIRIPIRSNSTFKSTLLSDSKDVPIESETLPMYYEIPVEAYNQIVTDERERTKSFFRTRLRKMINESHDGSNLAREISKLLNDITNGKNNDLR